MRAQELVWLLIGDKEVPNYGNPLRPQTPRQNKDLEDLFDERNNQRPFRLTFQRSTRGDNFGIKVMNYGTPTKYDRLLSPLDGY